MIDRKAQAKLARGPMTWSGTWIAGALLISGTILLLGLGLTGLINVMLIPEVWATRGDIGDSFGAVNAIVSGLALAALVVTLRLQSRELSLQRGELELQRQSLEQSRVELYRTAEASLRMLHVELIKLSIEDSTLAAVWPPVQAGASREKERQMLYANLVYQHMWLSLRISDYTEERVHNALRYIFASPIMREYWRATTSNRASLVPDTSEFLFAEVSERICREYDEAAASCHREDSGEP